MGGLHDLAGVRRVSWGGDGGGARDRPADAAARWRHVVQGASQQTVQERVWNGPAIPAQRLPAPESILRGRRDVADDAPGHLSTAIPTYMVVRCLPVTGRPG